MIKIVLKSFLVREQRADFSMGDTSPHNPLWGNPSRSPQTPYPYPYQQSCPGLQIMTGKIRLSLSCSSPVLGIQETGDRRQETGDRRQETGDRSSEVHTVGRYKSPTRKEEVSVDETGLKLGKPG